VLPDGTGVDVIETADVDPSGGSIHVLLVDDDEEWATFVANDLEALAEELSVSVVGRPNEALATLDERDDVECVVSDYRMPGVDGIELLERIREERPELALILVTGEGSEEVAARALDTGVNDYVVKRRGEDQAREFVRKIRSNVERNRLRSALEEREELYRTVTEESSDAICILRRGRVRFCNRRFAELTGGDRDSIRGETLDRFVFEADHEELAEVVERMQDGERTETPGEVRVVDDEGTVRHCEYTGRRIVHDGEPATLLSIRDVTDRRRRERELEWERELHRNVQRELVGSGSTERAELGITRRLREHGYDLAWVGHVENGELVPSAVAGDRDYLEAIDLSVGEEESDREPSVLALDTGEPQFHRDFGDLFRTGWCDAAVERGYRSGGAIPLAYDDVCYGVLGVYRTEPDQFDDTERRLLSELAESVAFALHSFGTERALMAETTVQVTVQLEDGHYLVDADRSGALLDYDAVVVAGTVPDVDDGSVVQYVTARGGPVSTIRDALGNCPAVSEVSVVGDGAVTRLQVVVDGPVPESHLAARGAIVRETVVERGGATIEAELPPREDPTSIVESLEGDFGPVSVRSVTTTTKTSGDRRQPWAGTLTQKQEQALRAAYFQGYFEQPRRNSATEIAESFDVTHSTFLGHLRSAERRIFESILEGTESE
jgi:PAS domain S-box-containing protein